MMPHAPTVVIVGGGALGAALFGILVDRLTARGGPRRKPRIVLVEKAESVGRGLAYSKDPAPYLLNQSAETMSLWPERASDFSQWLALRGLSPAGHGDHFEQREVFGDYAEDCFARHLETARRGGLDVRTLRGEVTTLAPRVSGGYRVFIQEQGPVDAEVVVLAIGNLPSTRFPALRGPRFVPSPYPSATLRRRIPARSRVAILGSGLSAIDAAIALFDAGHEGHVTLVSRHGMLPAVRGPLQPCVLSHVTRANVARATDHGRHPLRWEAVVGWLSLELEDHGLSVAWDRDFPAWVDPLQRLSTEIGAAEAGPRLWQSVGEALNPMVEVVWHHLAPEDRLLFDRCYRSRFFSHWVPIPLAAARTVLGLLREGKLTVERGLADATLEPRTGTYRLRLAERDAEFDFLVDATGAPRHLHESDSPLLEALLGQGTIAAHPFGGVRVDFESLRVLGRDGRVDPSLFALGNLTCGTHLFTSTLERNLDKAGRIGAQVVDELYRRIEDTPLVDATPHSS